MSTPSIRLFGTDGVRGEAGRFPLDAETLYTVGQSLSAHLREKLNRVPVIVVGRDTRESGGWLERALIEGALAAGAECKSAGVITTPGVAFLARTLPADAGVVISASHNSYQDNGFKIFAPSGKKLDDDTERLIEADILSQTNSQKPATGVRSSAPEEEVRALQSRYLKFLQDEIAHGLSIKGLTIVVDAANGAASEHAPQLLKQLGADVIAINNKPDGRNINRDCGSLHIDGLQQKVMATGADIGVAFDGDADRALFADARGQFVDGDATMWALAKYMSDRSQLNDDLVVATVMSNIGLEIALRSRGLRLLRTNVGDKYVLEELLRTGASLGGEQSGHIIFPHLSLAGDGLITTLCLLRAMNEEGKPLSELTEGFQRYPQVLVNVAVREKRPFNEVEEIRKLVEETESQLENGGRLLLRFSGTEPLARVMIEGKNQEEIETFARNLAAVIQQTMGAQQA
ncbi:MAG TPA: phosphoglucosamine mutase [Pyrinomonadaceae bacterium]|nr:phosphoglucosamine mutase [Pyrinomonadaceae bacterium]